MDGVEAVMLEQGYAAVTARSVAKHAGLQYSVVFYYFPTMDDLLVSAYRRRMERILGALEEELDCEQPLHAYWQINSDPPNAALSMEYMALANHNEPVRAEMIVYGERMRTLVVERLMQPLAEKVPDPEVFTPLALTTVITAIAHQLGFDSALGISAGHGETRKLVQWCLATVEPVASRSARGTLGPS